MSLFRLPSETVCLQLHLDRLDGDTATFTHFDGGTTVHLARNWWEGAGKPGRIEIPVTERLEGPLAEPTSSGASDA